MTRILPHVICWTTLLSTTLSGCRDTNDPPPGPSDTELSEAIDAYCDTVVPCYPGVWSEPEHDSCVEQQEEQAALSSECRKRRFDYYECVAELDSCLHVEAIGQPPGSPCRDEFVALGEFGC